MYIYVRLNRIGFRRYNKTSRYNLNITDIKNEIINNTRFFSNPVFRPLYTNYARITIISLLLSFKRVTKRDRTVVRVVNNRKSNIVYHLPSTVQHNGNRRLIFSFLKTRKE